MAKFGSKKYMLLNREYDGLTPTAKRAERMLGEKSKFYDVFVGRGMKGLAEGGLMMDRKANNKNIAERQRRGAGLEVDKRVTPKVGSSNTGRTGRFGHSDYRGNT